MRRPMDSWFDTFRKLGLKRWRNKSKNENKASDENQSLQFEQLEKRQMLSGVEVSVTGPTDPIREASGDTADFTVTLSDTSTSVVTVVVETNDISATGGMPGAADYTSVSATLTFAIGETISTLGSTVGLGITDDTTSESDETFSFDIVSAVGATIDSNADSATATITDDALVLFSGPSEKIREGSGDYADFTWVLAEPTDHVVKVVAETNDGTAVAGGLPTSGDYAGASGTLTFEIGETVATVGSTMSLLINDDTIAESDETFTMDINSVTGGSADQTSATATITDDALVLMTVNNGPIREASGDTADVTVVLAEPTDHIVKVIMETNDDTAVAGGMPSSGDYAGFSGTLTFQIGQTVSQFGATAELDINDDTLDESDETFTVDINSVEGGTASVTSEEVTITDDALVLMSGPASTLVEGTDTYATFTITLAEATDHVVEVVMQTNDDSATSGSDYYSASGTLTFQIGQTVSTIGSTISILLIDDTLVEDDEFFTMDINSVLGGDADDDSVEAWIESDD